MNRVHTFPPAARGFRSGFFNVGAAMDFSSIYLPRSGRPGTPAARLESAARRVAASWSRVGRRIMDRIEMDVADVAGK